MTTIVENNKTVESSKEMQSTVMTLDCMEFFIRILCKSDYGKLACEIFYEGLSSYYTFVSDKDAPINISFLMSKGITIMSMGFSLLKRLQGDVSVQKFLANEVHDIKIILHILKLRNAFSILLSKESNLFNLLRIINPELIGTLKYYIFEYDISVYAKEYRITLTKDILTENEKNILLAFDKSLINTVNIMNNLFLKDNVKDIKAFASLIAGDKSTFCINDFLTLKDALMSSFRTFVTQLNGLMFVEVILVLQKPTKVETAKAKVPENNKQEIVKK